MKKLLSIILVVGILMSVLCINTSAAELTSVQLSEQKLRRADIDGNGTFDLTDAQLLLKAAAGISEDNAEYDVDGDGYTSVQDAILVLCQAAGTGSVLTNEEALELFNAKLNAVKTDKLAFHGTSTVQCKSVKITQKVEASGSIMSGVINGLLSNMNYNDVEYDKYVAGMVESMKGNADESEIKALEESAKTYKDPVVGERTVAANSAYGHLLYFPREGKNVSSELTTNDIKSISYTMSQGAITFTVLMNNVSYTASTYPKDLYNSTYGKAFNVADLNPGSDSTLAKAEYKNGKIVVKLDSTYAIKSADYSYDYYSEIKAPEQSQTDPNYGTIKINLTTKTNASAKETFTF